MDKKFCGSYKNGKYAVHCDGNYINPDVTCDEKYCKYQKGTNQTYIKTAKTHIENEN